VALWRHGVDALMKPRVSPAEQSASKTAGEAAGIGKALSGLKQFSAKLV
jgi:hypothetical protein